MCGRYAQGKAIPELLARLAHLGLLRVDGAIAPGFNIAPTLDAAAVYAEGGELRLGPLRWGFVPRWTKSLDALKSKPINARSETADSGAMFRDAFRSARCLVPAAGFYEWQGTKAPKQPWFIHARDQELLCFAGLWSMWKTPEGGELRTFAILTTDANDTVRPIHNRMPCILRLEDEAEWLDPATPRERCKELLRPYPADATAAYRVSTAVNRAGVEGPELMREAEPLNENPGFLF